MTARPLAPEADLARVLHIAQQALQLGTMIDPEELLCQLLGLDEAQLQEWLDQPTPDEMQWDDPALVAAEQAEVEASRQRKPDQSVPPSRARAREAERAVWRQAEAGRLQHLVWVGRAMCAADDAGPWRAVPVTNPCPGCVELDEVLRRHG